MDRIPHGWLPWRHPTVVLETIVEDGYTAVLFAAPEEPLNDPDMMEIVAHVYSHHPDPRTGNIVSLEVEKKNDASGAYFLWGYGPVAPDVTENTLVKMTTFYQYYPTFTAAYDTAVQAIIDINNILPLLEENVTPETVEKYALANPLTRIMASMYPQCTEATRIALVLMGQHEMQEAYSRGEYQYYTAIRQYLNLPSIMYSFAG